MPQPACPASRRFRRALLAVLAGIGRAAASGAEKPSAGEVFGHEILPILEAKCLDCHGRGKTKGGLDLATLAGVLKGGSEGPAVIAGRSAASLLHRQITDGEMPPEGKNPVTADELKRIADWIDRSAFPDPAQIAALATAEVHARAKSLWSFQPVVRPALPAVKNTAAVRTPVDQFVLAKLESAGAALSPEADARTLARRVYFDLTGLPPTPEEVAAFEAESLRNPKSAFRNLAERLLASPRYGERWGRHWLDVAGWSESSSSVSDPVRPGHWRYRDWVIRAFNTDMPYDRFVREQLAGDELVAWREAEEFDAPMVDALVATGFLRSPPDSTDNQFIVQEDKMFVAQQTAMEVSTKALLGLTMNCVRCHDHKYDPITQEEYFGLIALFQPAYDPGKWVPGSVNKFGPGPFRGIPLRARGEREAFARRMEDYRERNQEMVREKMTGIPNHFRDRYLREHADALPAAFDRGALAAALAQPERERAPATEELVEAAARQFELDPDKLLSTYPEMQQRIDALKKRSEALAKQGMDVGEILWALWDVSPDPTPTRLLIRGDFKTPGREVAPGVLATLDRADAPWQPPAPDAARGTTGRRRALAEWITRPDHPLTARVMVNRIWQHHFGTGLVATPDDFGTRGAKPSHPELLDWLASEFVASGWSVKHIHRLILNSATWRQRATSTEDAETRRHGDRERNLPETEDSASHISPSPLLPVPASLLPAFPRRRLEAEAIRDAMLHVAGKLDLATGGESVPSTKSPDGSYDIAPGEPGRHRRSVYLTTRRSQVPTLLTLFDAPIMDTNWPVRSDSAIASQALALMHHPFVLECADDFAGRLIAEETAPARRLERAFALAFNRAPAPEERELFSPVLTAAAGEPEKERAAWRTVAHALFASSEFIYVD